MKKATSFRIEEVQVKQLEELVEYYKKSMKEATKESFEIGLSKANIVELLIKEKYQELKEQGKL